MPKRTRSLACEIKKHTSKSPQVRRTSRPSLRNGFNGFLRDLLGEPGLLSPSQAAMRKHCRRLDASVGASGPHDFAVRDNAFVACAVSSTASLNPTFVTIAKRPSYRGGTARACRDDLPDGQSGKFFAEGLDTIPGDLPVGEITPSGEGGLGREPIDL